MAVVALIAFMSPLIAATVWLMRPVVVDSDN